MIKLSFILTNSYHLFSTCCCCFSQRKFSRTSSGLFLEENNEKHLCVCMVKFFRIFSNLCFINVFGLRLFKLKKK